ncbi:Hypothetical predicted protein [Marmota monax]|uniref:Uncharacterized protein n=1 Tax=Marmota monax TaxID=9995 RepID=A0A5E4C5W2_MARMO|nr:Hypothetical predicted protein [Marmota monax]
MEPPSHSAGRTRSASAITDVQDDQRALKLERGRGPQERDVKGTVPVCSGSELSKQASPESPVKELPRCLLLHGAHCDVVTLHKEVAVKHPFQAQRSEDRPLPRPLQATAWMVAEGTVMESHASAASMRLALEEPPCSGPLPKAPRAPEEMVASIPLQQHPRLGTAYSGSCLRTCIKSK